MRQSFLPSACTVTRMHPRGWSRGAARLRELLRCPRGQAGHAESPSCAEFRANALCK